MSEVTYIVSLHFTRPPISTARSPLLKYHFPSMCTSFMCDPKLFVNDTFYANDVHIRLVYVISTKYIIYTRHINSLSDWSDSKIVSVASRDVVFHGMSLTSVLCLTAVATARTLI